MRRFCPNPIFVIIDVRPDVEGIPTTAYMSVEEVETVSHRGFLCLHTWPFKPAISRADFVRVLVFPLRTPSLRLLGRDSAVMQAALWACVTLHPGREGDSAHFQAHPFFCWCIRGGRGALSPTVHSYET